MDRVFSQEMNEMIKFYDEHYIFFPPVHLNTDHKIYLGDINKRECRFCGTKDPNLFKLEAHAFPEFIGNRKLISTYECDICNEKFSRTIEDHLAKYTLLDRTIARIKGKTGIPSLKSQSKRSRVDVINNNFDITYHPNDNCVELDLNNKRVSIHVSRQPYIPRSAFKCLVKMAISILPENELHHFTKTIEWLNIENHLDDTVTTKGAFSTIYSFTPGPKPYPSIMAILLKRKIDAAALPFMIFFIAFSHFTFQIAIPLSGMDDHWVGKQLTLPAFPNIYHDGTPFGNVKYLAIDLSSNRTVCDESDRMYLNYNTIQKIDP